jgi:hypothetical protein
LIAISAPPGVLVTRPLIEAIRADEERDLIAQRLAGEVALARTLGARCSCAACFRPASANRTWPRLGRRKKRATSLTDLTAEIDGLV